VAIGEATSADLATASSDDLEPTSEVRERGTRSAFIAFAAYVAVSFFVLIHIGRHMWFYEDDWKWFARDLTPSGLFEPFYQHWVTLPVLVYQVLYRTVGANYLPYQMCTIALHLAVAVLLRVIMRRVGVRPWTATIVAGAFVLFGAGHEGIMVSIQMSLVGSVVLGLCHVVCADHDGGFSPLDGLGLACGALALMSSGIGTIMVVIVGAFVLLRRGWRMALLHTVPLIALDALWYFAEDAASGGRHDSLITGAARWIFSGERAVFSAIGAYGIVGLALFAVLVGGLVLAWRPLSRTELRRRAAAPVALLLGGPVLFAMISIQRGYLSDYEKSSRFVNLAVAFTLPALAVAVDAIARKWPKATALLLALLLVGIVVNVDRFPRESNFPVGFFAHDRAIVLGAAYSPLADDTPRDLQPYNQLYHGRELTIGFLVDARKDGRLPDPPKLTEAEEGEIAVRLGVEQTHGDTPRGITCGAYYKPLTIRPEQGAVYKLDSFVAINYGDQAIDDPMQGAVFFEPDNGRNLKILQPGMVLTVRNAYDSTWPFGFCSRGPA
jgi:hypothetical protein